MKEAPLNIKGFVCVALVILFFLFQNQILEFYNILIVNKLLNSVSGNEGTYFLMFLLTELTAFLFICLIQYKIRVRDDIAFLAALSLCSYVYYRFFSNEYSYIYWEKVPEFKYSDYTIILLGGLLAIKVYNYCTKLKNPVFNDKPFLVDVAIGSATDDIFNRKALAKLLAEKIQSKLDHANAGALAIGINGVWGAGKTSFTNLIRENLNTENRIVIDFNPWRSSTPAKVIEDYFELLISELRNYDPKLSKSISDYAKTLTKIDENLISKSIETISSYLFEDTNKNENYNAINESIQKIKKQVIIFIDDLDRLDKKEIIEVLRIIRNTASFNNLVYVASYDKSYVLEAVKDFNAYNFKFFLEKVFQYEFLLPICDPGILRTRTKNILTSKLDSTLSPFVNAAIDYRSSNGKSLTNRVVKTHRDVVRLCNTILFEIESIKFSVNFIDFYFVQLLKMKFDGVYKFISNYRDLIFIKDKNQLRLRRLNEKYQSADSLELLKLFDTGHKSKEKKEGEEQKTVFQAYIEGNTSEELTEIDKELIIDLMSELMIEKVIQFNSMSKDPKSFVNYDNF